MAGLSMGGMQTHNITLAHLDTLSHIGLFSGGSIGITEFTDLPAFRKKVKVVFIGYGSREIEPGANAAAAAAVSAATPRRTPMRSKRLASTATSTFRRRRLTNGSPGDAASTSSRRCYSKTNPLRSRQRRKPSSQLRRPRRLRPRFSASRRGSPRPLPMPAATCGSRSRASRERYG